MRHLDHLVNMQVLLLFYLFFVKSVDVWFECALAHRLDESIMLLGLFEDLLVGFDPLKVEGLESFGLRLFHVRFERRGRLELLLLLLREFGLLLRPLLLVLLLPLNNLLT